MCLSEGGHHWAQWAGWAYLLRQSLIDSLDYKHPHVWWNSKARVYFIRIPITMTLTNSFSDTGRRGGTQILPERRWDWWSQAIDCQPPLHRDRDPPVHPAVLPTHWRVSVWGGPTANHYQHRQILFR